jgi:hypothetical protein
MAWTTNLIYKTVIYYSDVKMYIFGVRPTMPEDPEKSTTEVSEEPLTKEKVEKICEISLRMNGNRERNYLVV